MLNEAVGFVRPKKGGRYIDCTLGGGGYTSALAKVAGKEGLVIAFDLDEKAIVNSSKKNLDNVRFVNDNFSNLKPRVVELVGNEMLFDGIVMDLGLSSAQIDDPDRGFSFKFDNSLDMSFSGDSEETKNIINHCDEKSLSKIIFEYGEEKFARNIAKAIVVARKEKVIATAKELSEIVKSAIPARFHKPGLNPATKTFQALRIETNGELEALKKVLPQAVSLLKPGGYLAVVSFHSLEDRIVKDFFKQESRDCLCPPRFPACRCGHKAVLNIVSKKPIAVSEKEAKENPRARSAKLRVAEKK